MVLGLMDVCSSDPLILLGGNVNTSIALHFPTFVHESFHRWRGLYEMSMWGILSSMLRRRRLFCQRFHHSTKQKEHVERSNRRQSPRLYPTDECHWVRRCVPRLCLRLKSEKRQAIRIIHLHISDAQPAEMTVSCSTKRRLRGYVRMNRWVYLKERDKGRSAEAV